MMVLVSYDISTMDKQGQARLRRIAKACLNHGQRVQNSVYECEVEPATWVAFREQLLGLYRSEKDSLRFYFLGHNWRNRVEHHGAKPSTDFDEPMII